LCSFGLLNECNYQYKADTGYRNCIQKSIVYANTLVKLDWIEPNAFQ